MLKKNTLRKTTFSASTKNKNAAHAVISSTQRNKCKYLRNGDHPTLGLVLSGNQDRLEGM